jgi:hypothetical protein
LATEAQRRNTEQAPQKRVKQDQPPLQRDVTNQGPPAYQVAGLKLGQTIDLKSPELSGIDCKPSETFAEASFCSRKRTVNSPRGAYVETTSLLMSDDDKTLYINQSLSPAFWSDGEAESDIGKISRKYQLSPSIKTLPGTPGQPQGTIATWGSIRLEPISRSDREVLADGQSPKIGILVDFLNDLSLSAKQDLPIFRVRGSGYVWAATVTSDGKGKLRVATIDTSQFDLKSTQRKDLAKDKLVPAFNEINSAELAASDGSVLHPAIASTLNSDVNNPDPKGFKLAADDVPSRGRLARLSPGSL